MKNHNKRFKKKTTKTTRSFVRDLFEITGLSLGPEPVSHGVAARPLSPRARSLTFSVDLGKSEIVYRISLSFERRGEFASAPVARARNERTTHIRFFIIRCFAEMITN